MTAVSVKRDHRGLCNRLMWRRREEKREDREDRRLTGWTVLLDYYTAASLVTKHTHTHIVLQRKMMAVMAYISYISNIYIYIYIYMSSCCCSLFCFYVCFTHKWLPLFDTTDSTTHSAAAQKPFIHCVSPNIIHSNTHTHTHTHSCQLQ